MSALHAAVLLLAWSGTGTVAACWRVACLPV